MIKIDNKKNCCGCTACESICAHKAITMQPDALGFLYPVVDANKCVECGLCEKVCAFNDNYDKSQNLLHPIVYGARHKDIAEVESSRSGAAFIAISDYILENGGIVYGAGYTEHFRVIHKRAVTKEERNEFKGSKYVQSDLTGIFSQVKKDLRDGYTVLFSGTPCQTAGLHSFIGNKLNTNLILMDIVCHGVPSPYIWRDYLSYMEEKHKSEICYANFRDKNSFGWKAHRESYVFKKNEKKVSSTIYTSIFYQHIMLRHSCGECKYTNLQRPSDITIADFWGWEKTNASINADDKGLSLVICNTEKGKNIFDTVKTRMEVVLADINNCLQPNLVRPTKIHPQRMTFEKDYINNGIGYIIKKYGNSGLRYYAKKYKKKIKKLIYEIIWALHIKEKPKGV